MKTTPQISLTVDGKQEIYLAADTANIFGILSDYLKNNRERLENSETEILIEN